MKINYLFLTFFISLYSCMAVENEKSDRIKTKSNRIWQFTFSSETADFSKEKSSKGNWNLVRLPDRLPLLFNLDRDPSELNNVASKNWELVAATLKELGDWDVSTPQVLYLEGNPWRRNQVDLYDKNYQLEQPK